MRNGNATLSTDSAAPARTAGNSTAQESVALYTKQAAEIAALHDEIVGQWATMLDKAIEAGALLTTIKEELPHGQWLPWIAANLPFSDRTARNYINCYANRDRLKLETVSDLTTAYKLLAAPKSNPPKPSTVRAILEEENERDATERAAAAVGVMVEDVRKAELIASRSPELAQQVKDGTLTLDEAVQRVEPLAVDPLEAPKPIRESKLSNNQHCLRLYWRKANKADKQEFLAWAGLEVAK